MKYTKEQLQAIKKVKYVFEDFITNSKVIDLIWSNKVGYILIDFNLKRTALGSEPIIITDATCLCLNLFESLEFEIFGYMDTLNDINNLSPQEKHHIRTHIQPFLNQLPEYSHLVKKLYCYN